LKAKAAVPEEGIAAFLISVRPESERNLIDQIRRNLPRSMNQRTNFLRKRAGLRGPVIQALRRTAHCAHFSQPNALAARGFAA